jgi:hypothetical protein
LRTIAPLFYYRFTASVIVLLLSATFANQAFAQAEAEPWGNITGIRRDGQLFDFESIIKIQRGNNFISTGKERQHPRFKRNGDEQIITTNIDSLYIKEVVKDESDGKASVTVTLYAHADMVFDNVFFTLQLPDKEYGDGSTKLAGVHNAMRHYVPSGQNYDGVAKGAQFKSATSHLEINFDNQENIRIRKDISGANDLQLYVSLRQNGFVKGDSLQKTFTIAVSGDIDTKKVNLTIDPSQPGRPFDGLGGNFRLQNPKFDPEVIDYCLQNLRVAFGRVEMPWRFWQPNMNVDPTATADSGKLPAPVKKAMEMAQRLDSLRTPFILSAWFPPNWAIVGKPNFRPVNGVWGNPLNKNNMQAIYKSIADYILYLKNKYHAEPKYFSFNESDLGINIRISPQEHDDFIKGCGAYFASQGINTKMLLGDNSDATTYKFIDIAMSDAAAKPYIGAVSFHSWRGWDTNILQHWADAATRLNVPLLVAEGSIDAAAWNYPDIFQEQTYALKEINLYTRLIAICQPQSILQWQLTSDYSPLIGGGIFGNNEPLHPGQRFWNLKQLSITPKGLYAMPASCDATNITAAALGDNSKHVYAIQLVNNGAKRKVVLTGLPAQVKQLQIYTTSKELSMKEGSPLKVKNGKVKFKIEATSYTSLIDQ